MKCFIRNKDIPKIIIRRRGVPSSLYEHPSNEGSYVDIVNRSNVHYYSDSKQSNTSFWLFCCFIGRMK